MIQFDFVKQNALINLNSSENFDYYFKKLLSDDNFYKNIINNSQIFLNQYLTNIGNASSNLVQHISNI
jgi:hypothetical protein